MIDINLLRNDIDKVATNVAHKKVIIDTKYFGELEAKRKSLQVTMEELQAKRNSSSKQIGVLDRKSVV